MFDLIVVGAGLAGLSAAIRASQAGQRVEIIAKGLGTTHWGAGTIDVLGYFPDETVPVTRPLAEIANLAQAQPHHPYALIEAGALKQSFHDFSGLVQQSGLEYLGAADPGANLWLPSPIGVARPAYLAPRAQIAGDLSRPEPILVVGLQGLRDFYPELIAENLNKQGHAARAATLPLELVAERRDLNTAQLALALDEPARRAKLGSELAKLVRAGERIALPAILGMNDHAAALNDLSSGAQAPVFEIPTLPPSVPGIRLYNSLQAQFRKIGGRVDVNMKVIGFHAQDRRIVWLETDASGRPLKHRADRFLLATGGILGGGITTDHLGAVGEVVLNLPLAAPASRDDWFRARFLDPSGHPIFRAGLPVDSAFQPIDAQGERVYSNVFAAGGLLADADPILERSLEGIALATGAAAGRSAAETHIS